MQDDEPTAYPTSVCIWTQADRVQPRDLDRAQFILSHAMLHRARQVLPYAQHQSTSVALGPTVHTAQTITANPESSSVKSTSPVVTQAQYNGDLAQQSWLPRCITPPYFTVERLWPTQEEPIREHASIIAHSFVDVDRTFTKLSALESFKGHDETRQGGTMSSGEAMTRLGLGHRGAWLVPVSFSLPIPRSSGSKWATCHSDPFPTMVPCGYVTRSTTETTMRGQRHSLPPPIVWTDARVRALWSVVTSLGGRTDLGQLNAKCTFRSSPVSAPAAQRSLDWPELIRVSCDSHYALRVRRLLGLVTVAMARMGPEDDRFLLAAHLVWVDEKGDPVFTAAG
ncbi:hypothetical protein MVLG_06698 [Microbotryum lychnidis-dioicae p1A1 Lamole]|uniref:Uncharacterized protein n=1 Tax=Microbotryum lychnidis-dioicae (strain p1A1 Lamole / MvSl-1064) TaxID=683840 RepID=U5HI31_USTV1|nr:hypothetical protein MVLG_06698 [Microbotryum lychnidis-dioicae p1A1 Lamole]|eukprot:KDE02776.1 hypothetical protein MVLG_06698 [Microbotryum lychnidis-dioicae p1A1 Lamole]